MNILRAGGNEERVEGGRAILRLQEWGRCVRSKVEHKSGGWGGLRRGEDYRGRKRGGGNAPQAA